MISVWQHNDCWIAQDEETTAGAMAPTPLEATQELEKMLGHKKIYWIAVHIEI